MNESDKQAIVHKEIDLIQNCISRMAQNQFMIKGWYLSIIVVISAWKMNDSKMYITLVCLCSLIFYIINLQFYIFERRFRILYKQRIELRCITENYKQDLYSLELVERGFSEAFKDFWRYAFKNWMLFIMYLGFCILLVIANFYINLDSGNDTVKIEVYGIKSLLE